MPQFRKKPAAIEAVQFPGLPSLGYPRDEIQAMEHFDTWLSANQGERACRYKGNSIIISTLEGDLTASPGDWIIRGVQGELYPCKPDIFAETYEEAALATAAEPESEQSSADGLLSWAWRAKKADEFLSAYAGGDKLLEGYEVGGVSRRLCAFFAQVEEEVLFQRGLITQEATVAEPESEAVRTLRPYFDAIERKVYGHTDLSSIWLSMPFTPKKHREAREILARLAPEQPASQGGTEP